jgi:hypothetical protein
MTKIQHHLLFTLFLSFVIVSSTTPTNTDNNNETSFIETATEKMLHEVRYCHLLYMKIIILFIKKTFDLLEYHAKFSSNGTVKCIIKRLYWNPKACSSFK